MKFCEEHWSQLRAQLDTAGLGHLVSPTGEEAGNRLRAYSDHGREWTPETYDPLLAASMAIINNLLESFGPRFLELERAQLGVCGICWANAEHAVSCDDEKCSANPFDAYIAYAVGDEVSLWLELSVQ